MASMASPEGKLAPLDKKVLSSKTIDDSDDRYEYVDEKARSPDEIAELSGIESTAASKAAWLISLTVSIGGFLFGYDTGYISSVLVTIGTSLGGSELSSSQEELVTSITSGGALIGAVVAGLTADKYGRRKPIWLACVVFVIGTVLQCAAFSLAQFTVGRFMVGLGVGLAAMIVPLYIGEIAPAQYRGRMIAFNNMSVTFGQLVASAIGAGFAQAPGQAWRGTVAIGGLPPFLLGGLLFMCPESPRQLVAHGNVEAADKALLRIYRQSTPQQRAEKIKSIEMSIEEALNSMTQEPLWKSFKRIFNTPATGRAVLTACMIMAISQLGGFNTLMYYAARIFAIVGFSNATAVAITVSATNFVFSLVNLVLVDRFGRRIILCITVLGMSICMAIAVAAFRFIPIDLATLTVTTDNVGWPGTLVLITIICYVACFSSGVATIAWIGTELIPLEVRALGTMLNTVTCWGTNIIIASTFLTMMKSLTPSGAFGFYCGICFIGWLFIIFCYPECKGMPLEEIRVVFSQGFGVKYSKQWQRDHKFDKKQVQQSFGH
ncbi:Sugar (and other) transporter-like protein 42 [Elsinoe fawcettii]|nr:Sugar (and other) transporter-like protein 42 [Elsinoe fawcettii]